MLKMNTFQLIIKKINSALLIMYIQTRKKKIT